MSSDKSSETRLETLLLEQRVPCAFVKAELCSTPSLPAESKYYGVPYTPVGFQWPTTPDGTPLRFVGQINMQEFWSQAPGAATVFPRSGLLQFYAAGTEFVGPYQRNNWRVVWHEKVSQGDHERHPNAKEARSLTWLERGLLRIGIDFDSSPREQRITFEDGGSVPSFDVLPYVLPEWPIGQSDLLRAFDRLADRKEQGGKLLGYAHAVQDDPRIEALMGTIQPHEASSPMKRGELIRRHLNDWQLLWQMPNFGYHRPIAMGGYYLVIRRSDLLAGHLGEALAVSDID